ncbi:hypothetical protein AGMMS49574_10090 [Bacteroidia bacterium]|nr:hypothetical protein AGMMS49574_10090 [Bacteroidia bacterium]
MKKVVMMLTVASSLVFCVACGGKKAEAGATDEAAAPATESVAPAASEDDALAKYEEYVNKSIALYDKVAAGDVAAAQDLAKLAQDYAPFLQELGTKQGEWSEAQIAKFQELAEKAAAAAQKAYGQQ